MNSAEAAEEGPNDSDTDAFFKTGSFRNDGIKASDVLPVLKEKVAFVSAQLMFTRAVLTRLSDLASQLGRSRETRFVRLRDKEKHALFDDFTAEEGEGDIIINDFDGEDMTGLFPEEAQAPGSKALFCPQWSFDTR
ncbi:hypothetical protein J4Q44_G00200430 [Coregonus suidteri]|uniref:Uncharacterized protein n=1 Tax=Coregonus suidteri TaxID=861788 RepID=A0AAN8R2N6_9TELE